MRYQRKLSNIYLFHKLMYKLISEENKVPTHPVDLFPKTKV